MFLHFQPIGMDDLPALRRLAEEIWPAAFREMLPPAQIAYMMEMMYAPPVLTEELARGVVWEFIVDDTGEALGYLSYLVEDARTVKLAKIYLKAASRGRGLAREVIEHVAEAARRLGRTRLQLTVNRRNAAAIRAYEKNGFVIAESVAKEIGNGFVMDDHVMVRKV